MKKLGKLTLKELGDSAIRLSLGEANGLKGGWPPDVQRDMDASGGGGGMIVLYGGALLPEFTCTSYRSAGSYPLGSFPPTNQTPIGSTPTQQYSQACAEGYTQAAQAIAFGAAVAVYSALEAWCIVTGKASAGTQWAITPDQYGGGVNNTTPVYNSK